MRTDIGKDLLELLERIPACQWVGEAPYCMYFYVKNKGHLPPQCHRCWKVLIFFDDEAQFERMAETLMKKGIASRDMMTGKLPWFGDMIINGRRYPYKTLPRAEGGMLIVIYVMGEDSETRKNEVHRFFRNLITNEGITARVFHRHAGRYWQDMFPELFGKRLEDYKPFYREYYDVRLKADRLSDEEIIKRARKELTTLI